MALRLLSPKRTAPVDDADAMAAIRRGFPASVLEHAAGELGTSAAALERLIGLPSSTARKKRAYGELLRSAASDRLFRVMRVYRTAVAVLETREAAQAWLHVPNRALRGEKPIDLLDTDVGVIAVERVLERIEHSVYS